MLNDDEFFKAEIKIRNDLEEVRQCQANRNKLHDSSDKSKNNLKRIKLSTSIKKKFEDIAATLEDMEKILTRQSKAKDSDPKRIQKKSEIRINFSR
jgi:hypothetical protein